MERIEPTPNEPDVNDDIKSKARGRVVKAALILSLILIILMLPQRAQRYVWYTQSVTCLRCHPEMNAKLSEKNVHGPFKLRQCVTCHKEHASIREREGKSKNQSFWGKAVEKLLPRFIREDIWNLLLPPIKTKVQGVKSITGTDNLIKPSDQICMMCHQKIAEQMKRTNSHPPFNDKKCVTCHDPHASNFMSMTRQRSEDLCAVCHRMDNENARKLLHSPFESRSCTSCHTGHASEYKGLLKASQKEVCFSCHKGIAPQLSMAVQHPPFENGGCTGCHLPHASDAGFLLIEDMPNVCYRCHQDTKTTFQQSSRHPVGNSFTCLKCHEPHAAGNPSLLFARGNDVCYRCHDDIKPSFDTSKHAVLQFEQGRGACLGCHVYHGSESKPLLVNDQVSTCLKCHNDKSAGKVMTANHPSGGQFYDARRNSQLTCTSTCHWIHYIPNQALLKWEKDELCMTCHTAIGNWR